MVPEQRPADGGYRSLAELGKHIDLRQIKEANDSADFHRLHQDAGNDFGPRLPYLVNLSLAVRARHTRDLVVLALMFPRLPMDVRVLETAKASVISFLGQISWHSKHSACAILHLGSPSITAFPTPANA